MAVSRTRVSANSRHVVVRVGGWELLYTPAGAEHLAVELVKAAQTVRRNRLFLFPADALIGAANWVLRRDDDGR